MFHVVSCDKYNRQTIRLVQADDVEPMLASMMGECALCGPCSHVEVGQRGDHWTVHSSHKLITDAMDAAWDLTDREPELYRTDMLPQRPESTLDELYAEHSA